MTADSAFSVEDFLEALTAQLDRTQDALRVKAVNRPLTYAIRDFSMELKVFVELGADGRVMFRPSASDDSGASVVHIGFTTVNRTMIEENTVSLSTVRSPTLDELGLDEQERRGLERLGVRNAAQLDRLRRTTGEAAVARFSGLPVSRLRQAMAQGRPSVRTVRPAGDPTDPGRFDAPAGEVGGTYPAIEPRTPGAPPPGGDGGLTVVRLPGATRRLVVGGPRLDETTQRARLAGRTLDVLPVDGGVEIDLGEDSSDGTLELDLGDEGVVALALQFDPVAGAPQPPVGPGRLTADPWRSP